MMMKRLLSLGLLLAVHSAHAQVRQTLLVLNKGENTLALVDPATNKVLAKIPTGDGPHEVAVSTDGRKAYVANYGGQQPGNTLSIIDIEGRKEEKRVDLGPFLRPHGIVEKNGKVFFTSEVSRTIACYDPLKDKITWIAGTGQSIGHMIALTPDGKRAYVTNILSNTVSSINIGAPPTPEHMSHIAVGLKPEALDVSPDGKELLVGQNDDGNISVIETATNTVKQTIRLGQSPIRIKYTPDGRLVLVSDYKSGELVVLDAATKNIIKRIPVDGVPVGILVTPDSRRAYVARMQANTVSVLDLEKLAFTGNIEPGAVPDGLGWSQIGG